MEGSGINLEGQAALVRDRRRFLSNSLGIGLAAYLPSLGGECRTIPTQPGFPFSPSRTVVLLRRPGRRHSQARRVIERKVDELAGMDLLRLPKSKVDALLQVAGAVTDHYGIGDRLDAWAERIPIMESFTS